MEHHALVVPLPLQSHVNALFNFAKLLSSRGVIVTFLNADHIHHSIFQSAEAEAAAIEGLRRQGLRFRFESVAYDFTADHGRELEQLVRRGQSWAPPLEEFVSKMEKQAPPLTCVIADAFMSTCAHHFSLRLRLPRVVFWPFCAAASVAQCHTRLLISKGCLPFKSGRAEAEGVITCLPGIPPVLRPVHLTMSHVSEEMFSILTYESDFQNNGDWVVVNSFEELEGKEAIRGLATNSPALYVGPVFSVDQEPQMSRPCALTNISLWNEDPECLGWLDRYPSSSVLYVSFGSLAVLPAAQVHEVALGLEASGFPFLWAMRSELVEGNSTLLPNGFRERTRDRSLLVEWSPQREVLSHGSVGGFLTHCGWNSMLESISSGVPMIGLPMFGDQFLNCKLMEDVWKIGLGFADLGEGVLVSKEEVEKLVRWLMEGEDGKAIRHNVKRLQRSAMDCVMPGGSSSANIDMLVRQLHNKSTTKPLTENCHIHNTCSY